jgi:hypothetical protein
MRTWFTIGLLGLTLGVGSNVAAHALSMQECFEGGDFIAHAAQARDNGATRTAFLDTLTADISLIRAFPAELRWFVADVDDAEFLSAEASEVFDNPQVPEAHRAQFLSRCFARMARVV